MFENLTQTEIEYLLEFNNETRTELENKLRDKYRKHELNDLINLKNEKIKNDIIREKIRNNLQKESFYQLWSYNKITNISNYLEEVLSEQDYNTINYSKYNLNSVKCFISHFSQSDKIAKNLKSFIEFFKADVFVDDIDGGKIYGSESIENGLRDEITKRPFFIFLAINEQIRQKIQLEISFCNELKNKNENRPERINVILDELSANRFNEFSINESTLKTLPKRPERFQYFGKL